MRQQKSSSIPFHLHPTMDKYFTQHASVHKYVLVYTHAHTSVVTNVRKRPICVRTHVVCSNTKINARALNCQSVSTTTICTFNENFHRYDLITNHFCNKLSLILLKKIKSATFNVLVIVINEIYQELINQHQM